ncbi:LOW QUALITY PROTEIN: single-strand DNA endonuclease ASTE1 [Mastacembelus armatus]|uniref:LOW QUALITY PROTEIN: single-strand DNA endonuclease ASTE1 n=1 Tax=Mastacembelus armatus TaxID=205130 RepID=UPI000E455B51|nr:LOW QUALITY PROTEIN: protein asteroid homolog 1-like [Mastacembelus armatus]
MGVQGLATLLETYGQIYRDVRFMRSRLVVDGCNLLYLLYFNSGLDENHGGQYAAFEDLIEKFVTAMTGCGITPYVVLDGGSDYTDKKVQTLTLRAEQLIKKAHQAAAEGTKKHILPLLAKMVFKQTLVRLGVPVAQCYSEADQEIAALAIKWQCPVLSNDSDFYIFELPAGLLPISHFRWKDVKQNGSQRYIPCKSYNTSSFCIFFNIQRQLLPTFAALAGNDYVKLQWTGSFISWTQFAPAGSERTGRLEGLLCWLRNFQQPEQALQAALGLMGELSEKKKVEVLEGLALGMEEYRVPSSSLNTFFLHHIAPPFPAVDDVVGLVPDWMLQPLTQARLTADVLDVLLLQRMSLSFPVDKDDMPSACLTSRPLRQLMYGLLLGRGGARHVEETDRVGLQLKIIKVPKVVVTQQLVLSSLDKAEHSERLQVLLEALGVTEASLIHLPPQLRLPVAVTCYWLQRAQPPPAQTLLKALLLGLSNEDTLRHRAALQAQKTQYKGKVDGSVAHTFNQWQVCLKDSIHLNQLLGFPLPEPQIARLYEGTVVHQLVHMMRTGGRLKAFLRSSQSSVKQYHKLLSVILRLHSQKLSTSSRSQKATAARRKPLGDLTASLQQLFILDEETETEIKSMVRVQEDLQHDDLLSMKTRYRTKERINRCKNPELARKEECRGRDHL